MDTMKTIVMDATINNSKQGFKMSGDGSETMVLDLDAKTAILNSAFYAYACINQGPLKVEINLLPVKVYK